MKKVLPYAGALVVLLLAPLWLHRGADWAGQGADETLVIITPHNEATRYEFARAFEAAHFARTGRRVFVDWRTAGGTSEIARYIASQYLGSFRDYWSRALGREWTVQCAAFDDPKALAPAATEARRAFLASNVGCGVDLFFGGGSFDYMQMAAAGKLVDSGVIRAHPELFALSGAGGPASIPRTLGGEPLWDARGCWLGACLGEFGICYNTDSLTRLGITQVPTEWTDLGSPRLENEVALADPTQSGSVAKAFEMILQQAIASERGPSAADPGRVAAGWLKGMGLIQRIAANSRYFTDGATEIPYSVAAGDAAAGMCIDFYGRFESDAVRGANGASRLGYVTPAGGSSAGADSIGMFRGAPHPDLAREFMEFVISPEGQKLWCFRAGTPGGPEKYTLRRLPIRPDLYTAQWQPFEADPGVDPYADGGRAFIYHPEWTGSLFAVTSFCIRTAFIDPHDELKSAWETLIKAGFPPRATAAFSDLSAISYASASGQIRAALRSPDKLAAVALARELDERFRAQYLRAESLARQGR